GGFRGGDRPSYGGAGRSDGGFRGGDRPSYGGAGRSDGGFRGGDRPSYGGAGRSDGGFRGGDRPQSRGPRRDFGGDRGDRGFDGRADGRTGSRAGGTDRPARGHGFSRAMSDRIGGAFPDDRPTRAPRSGGADRPGARGTHPGASRGATGRPSSYGTRPDSD